MDGTNDMVERVARAIGEHYDGWVDPKGTPNRWPIAVNAARAAIEAMRNVPKPMRKFHTPGGELIDLSANCNYCGGHEFAWHSLIDEALK